MLITIKIVDEKTMADVNEKSFEGTEAFDKAFNEDGQKQGGKVNEEELRAIEQQTEEKSPNIMLATGESLISSDTSRKESKDRAKVSIVQGSSLDRNEEDSTLHEFDIENEAKKASSWLMSENRSDNEVVRKRSLDVYDEDAIVPVAEEANLESSPFVLKI